MNPFQRLVVPSLLLIIIFAAGTSGFMLLEKLSVLNALYMVVITVSTVGFQEVAHLSDYGKIFTMVLIIGGVGTMAYAIGQFGEMIVEGQIIGYRRKRAMEKKISGMKNHYIICGYGRVGHQVAQELKEEKVPFVVIDPKPATAEELQEQKIPHIIDEESSDDALENANIKSAKALISCVDSDAANVLIILSAKALNPKLEIVARATDEKALCKLKKAGADKVIMPYYIAGCKMVAMALKPVATDFIDTVMHKGEIQLNIKEFLMRKNSKLSGKTLGKSQVRQISGATVLAIRHKDGAFESQPGAASYVKEDDVVVVIGTADQLEKFASMI